MTMIRRQFKHQRSIHTTTKLLSLFGAGTNMPHRPSPEQILRPPQNKSQAPANPADILKKNDILMYSNKPVNYIESIRPNGYYLANNYLISSPQPKFHLKKSSQTITTSTNKGIKEGEIKNNNNNSEVKEVNKVNKVKKEDMVDVGLLLLHTETYELELTPDLLTIKNDWYVTFNNNKLLSILEMIHPKPEILVVGLGKKSRMLNEENRKFISDHLGVLLEISDSINGARNFDLLATERPNVIGALLLPPNL